MSSNLSPEINANIAASNILPGFFIADLSVGEVKKIQTRNTLYTLVRTGADEYTLQGHVEFCPTPTVSSIHGSTWGGSMLKCGFVGVGMHLEFANEFGTRITTSQIQSIE